MTATPPHPAALPPDALAQQCAMRRLRRSGPGGQHRNKVETAVVLTHRPSGVQAEASERRSQGENRAAALFRLRVNLALEVRTQTPPERPSPRWRARFPAGRLAISAAHDDFPAILAEALDVLLQASAADPQAAAELLGCTASQLVRLLKKEPRGLALVNTQRQRQGQRPLR